MNNEIKFNYIERLWKLRGGIVYSKKTNKPISFSCKNHAGHRFTKIRVNGKQCSIYIHDAVWMLFHNRPIAEGKEIHHIDGNNQNNAPDNLVELTCRQHKRIHQYQCDDPMRGIYLNKNTWLFQWVDDDGIRRSRRFHGINDAMIFRAEIEEPRRQELRALGLNC